MTKKEWQLEHHPRPEEPEMNRPVPQESQETSNDEVDSWKIPDYTGKVKDSALLAFDPADFPRNQRPEVDIEDVQVKLKYPRSVFFIVVNEFCERFTFYGLRTILSLYFVSNLHYSEDESTVMYHLFIMLCYFFPVIGGIISDTWLGKYRTILYLSLVYSCGSVVLSFGSSGVTSKKIEVLCASLGLLLIAIGTGGIKPCVSAFGGDQFKIPEQRSQLQRFFAAFYFCINAGSLISTFITPIFRQDIQCLGKDSCYPLAFGVPSIVMIVSIVVFVCGRPLYKITPPGGNVLLQVCKCIGSAIGNRWKRRRTSPKQQRWIDYADSKYNMELRNDIMIVLKVLVLFIPLPMFWALYDQQGSRWTFQAVNMNGRIGSFIMKPDQVQVVNPVLILVLLPIVEGLIYPCLGKLRLLRKPLQRMAAGGILCAIAFVVSAIVELQMEKTYPVPVRSGLAQVRIFNLAPCQVHLSSELFDQDVDVDQMEMNAQLALKAIEATTFQVKVTGSCVKENTLSLPIAPKTARSVYLYKKNSDIVFSMASSQDTIEKNGNINAVVRLAYIFANATPHVIQLKRDSAVQLTVSTNATFGSTDEYKGVPVDEYSLWVDNKKLISELTLDVSGTYTLLVNESSAESLQVRKPNSVHMLWILPQYLVVTFGEVMFSVTGLEFAFTQAPVSMKAVLTSAWLLTVAFGNLIVLVLAETNIFSRRLYEILMFAGLMLIDVAIFGLIAMRYTYRDDTVSSGSDNATSETTANSNGRSDEVSSPTVNEQDATQKRNE